MKPLALFLLDLIYPPKCVYCDKLLAERDLPACALCTQKYFRLPVQAAMQTGESFSYCVSAAYYDGVVRSAFLQYKFHGEKHLSTVFSAHLAESIQKAYGNEFDCITWLPVSNKRLKQRGYDQSRRLAEGVAHLQGRHVEALLTHPKCKPPQSSLKGVVARRENVRDCFAVPKPERVKGKCILLIDDIITTGATMEEAARTLRAAGAREVMAATLCRTPPQDVEGNVVQTNE